MKRLDPFARPLDRLLEALRRAFGPAYALRAQVEGYSYSIACPSCVSGTASVTEADSGGPVAFSPCSRGCATPMVRQSADELVEFFVDGRDSTCLPIGAHNELEGWLVVMPLVQFAELLEEAA